ncbi:MAG: ribokinase [Chloroflexi bacterium]|nr:ribokinase [Chloroflexota bacterium]
MTDDMPSEGGGRTAMGLHDCSIVVIGSINMDLAVRCPRVPAPGETILGSSLLESPGGKGANQAVAAGTLGGGVAMVGCVGNDTYGDALRASLAAAKVNTDWVLSRGERSGVALIEVADTGENSIVVVPAANGLLMPSDVESALAALPAARIMLLQLEVPLSTVRAAARLGKQRGLRILLDPAPAQPLPPDLLAEVDILTPNQGEAAILLGRTGEVSLDDAPSAAAQLSAMGPRVVLLKLGSEGVLLYDAGRIEHVAGYAMATVDTTAAGDCLAGALATALAEGAPLHEAVYFANAAAAISTTRAGAQVSMPGHADVDRWLASH